MRQKQPGKNRSYFESCLGLKSGDSPQKRSVRSGVGAANGSKSTGQLVDLSLLIDSQWTDEGQVRPGCTGLVRLHRVATTLRDTTHHYTASRKKIWRQNCIRIFAENWTISTTRWVSISPAVGLFVRHKTRLQFNAVQHQ